MSTHFQFFLSSSSSDFVRIKVTTTSFLSLKKKIYTIFYDKKYTVVAVGALTEKEEEEEEEEKFVLWNIRRPAELSHRACKTKKTLCGIYTSYTRALI